MMKINVILGSVRDGRMGERVASWVMNELAAREGVTAELVDLRALDLPLYREPLTPNQRQEPYTNDSARRWSEVMAGADGFVFVTAEYNHTIPGAMSNALDYLWSEVSDKTASIVSYSTGMIGGARSAAHLSEVASYMQMIVAGLVHVSRVGQTIDESGKLLVEGLDQTLAAVLSRQIDLNGKIRI